LLSVCAATVKSEAFDGQFITLFSHFIIALSIINKLHNNDDDDDGDDDPSQLAIQLLAANNWQFCGALGEMFTQFLD